MRSSLVVPVMLVAVVPAGTEPEAQPVGATAHDQGGDGELSPLEEYLGEGAGRPWSEADPESLRELQEFEIEVASADEACRAEHFNDAFLRGPDRVGGRVRGGASTGTRTTPRAVGRGPLARNSVAPEHTGG